MVNHARLIWSLIALFTLCSVHGAWAGPPTDQLREAIDRVIKILRDPELKGDQNLDQRRTAIALAARAIFDFGEMSRRSLARHWENRTPAEQEEFLHLFTALIRRSYMAKVDRDDAARMITYRGETADAHHAVVQTTVSLNNGRELAVDYRMHNPRDAWRVYDLSIDGNSMVSSYRAQFNRVIRSSSYEALVARLKSNQAEFSAASAGAEAGR